ncbi:MAG: hypothetical protein RL885_03100 [Planctomycetota bacterium]
MRIDLDRPNSFYWWYDGEEDVSTWRVTDSVIGTSVVKFDIDDPQTGDDSQHIALRRQRNGFWEDLARGKHYYRGVLAKTSRSTIVSGTFVEDDEWEGVFFAVLPKTTPTRRAPRRS